MERDTSSRKERRGKERVRYGIMLKDSVQHDGQYQKPATWEKVKKVTESPQGVGLYKMRT